MQIGIRRAELSDGAQIDATAFGEGPGGNVSFNATEDIFITGRHASTEFHSGLFSNANGPGQGGNVTVTAGGSIVMNEGRILTRTLGEADAGTLKVSANNLTLLNGAQIFSGIGNAHADGTVEGSPTGEGKGGGLIVTVADRLFISGTGPDGFRSGLFSSAQIGRGNAGNIRVLAGDIEISDQGTISASSIRLSNGNAGDIVIDGLNTMRLEGGTIETETIQTDGGNITIDTRNLVFLQDSAITTSVESGFGAGGNITIDPQFVVLDNSQIIANAFGSPGGNIRIVTDSFFASPDSIVDASSQLGIDGTVEIDSPDTDITGGITILPESFFDAAALLRL
jgi:large exoprotein involved in heme utilization and adhesion